MDDAERAAARREDASLVERARADDPDAFGQLYDRWFGRVNDLAFRITHDSAAAADVAQDAFLAAWRNLARLQDPEAFGGWLLRITRNGALDRTRREERSRPYDTESMAMIERSGPSNAAAPAGFRVEDRATSVDNPERAAEDSELAALLWESAAALGERDAELLDLTVRHGLSPAEVGEVVGMNRNAANQAVHRVRGRLRAAIEARVLWRSGEPVCEGLAAALERAGVTRFGGDAVRVATSHAEKCALCQERRQTRLEPSKMFAAVPLIVAPMLLKMKVAHALSGSGVPMGGSEAYATEEPSHTKRRRRGPHVAAAGVGIVVLSLAAVGALANKVGELHVVETVDKTTTTTTLAPTTTIPFVGLPGPDVTTSTKPKRFIPPFVPAPPPPTIAASASISVSPASEPSNYRPGRVSASWSTSGGASVQVTGPEGLISTATSGKAAVCPSPARGVCGTTPGVYTYTVTVRDGSGNVVAQQSATLTIT
jgi:RNA polymerase sigma factor (sigma-70 family)